MKVPLKVRASVWMLVLGRNRRINTNAMLQNQRPGLDISPNIVGFSNLVGKSCSHVFYICMRNLGFSLQKFCIGTWQLIIFRGFS